MSKTKFLYFIIAVLACLLPMQVLAKDKSKSPKIEFKKTTHDFGVISENGGPVTHEFTFTNKGNAPLIIVSAKATCGCTQPSYPKEPIKPGESGVIKVTYNPAGRPGPFNKQIAIRTNDKRDPKSTVRIKGEVKYQE